MSMSKKDYIAIAAAIQSAYEADSYYVETHQDAITHCAENIASACAADNPRFDRARFLAACGVQS